MEEQTLKILEINDNSRKENDKTVGLVDEDGPIKYLNMEADDFNIMTADELFSVASSLNCLSFKIQRFQSDNEAAANRLERYINKSVAFEIDNYQGYSYEERKQKAIINSKVLNELDKTCLEFKQKAEQHKYLSKSINDLATTIIKKAELKKWRSRD
jgi:hypothetical protein